jgi:hypothetical protein
MDERWFLIAAGAVILIGSVAIAGRSFGWL